MTGIFHLSEMLSLALHSMVYIATSDDEYVNVKRIAASTGASEAHLSKVLQRLAKGRLIHSIRGPRGGFALALPAEEMQRELQQLYLQRSRSGPPGRFRRPGPSGPRPRPGGPRSPAHGAPPAPQRFHPAPH